MDKIEECLKCFEGLSHDDAEAVLEALQSKISERAIIISSQDYLNKLNS